MKQILFHPMMIGLLLVMFAFTTGYDSALAAPWSQDKPSAEQAQALFDAGLARLNQGEYQAALEAFTQASVLYRALGNQEGEATALSYIGISHKTLGHWQAAITALTQSLPLWEALAQVESMAVIHNELAFNYLRLFETAQAEAHAMTALLIATAHNFPAHSATAHFYWGVAAVLQDKPHTALLHLEAALPLLQELGRHDEHQVANGYVAEMLSQIAKSAQANGQYIQALHRYERAQRIYHELADQTQEGRLLNEMGTIYLTQAKYQAAQASFQTALTLCHASQHPLCQMAALNNLGEVYDKRGQYPEALAHHREALTFCQAESDCPLNSLADLRHNLGRDYIHLGDYSAAAPLLKEALQASREAQDPVQEVIILNSQANLAMQQADYTAAFDLCQTALTLAKKLQFAEGEEASLITLGNIYQYRGELRTALRTYEEALALARDIADRSGEGTAHVNIGGVYEALGQYEAALAQQQAALQIWQTLGDVDGKTVVNNQLGAIYDSLGQYTKALAAYDATLALARQIGHRNRELAALNNKAVTLFKIARYDDALPLYQEALSIAQAIGQPENEARLLDNIGAIHAKRGQHQAAFTNHEQALTIRQQIGDRIGEGVSHHNIGVIHRQAAAYTQALQHFITALTIFTETGQIDAEAETYVSIGQTYEQQDKLPEAIQAYQQAVRTVETLHDNLTIEEYATTFDASQMTKYNRLINALVATADWSAAFDYAERARARAFLNQIGNQRVDIRIGAAPERVAEEQALYQKIVGLQNALKAEHSKPFDQQNRGLLYVELPQQLAQAQQAYADLLILLKQENPEYATLVSVDTLTVQGVQQQVLDPQTTLIEYFITDEQLLAWVIDQNAFTLVPLATHPQELRAQIEAFLIAIADQDFDADAATFLYDMLIAPLKPHIRQPNLLIVPHGLLHYLPFAALWDEEHEHYLIEDFTITYAPSASALKFVLDKRNPDQERRLILGNPDGSLPAAEDEVRMVARLFTTNALVRGQATESQIYAQAGQLDLLHLAAHGILNEENPLYTRIELTHGNALTTDGNLMVYEVFGLDLTGANLVVLSACQTALGERSAGDEVVGLTRAFLYAGAPSVVTTLWPIDDEASGELMVGFYRNLHAGMTIAAALQKAQVERLRQNQGESPYYWAAFTLTGDYRGGD